MASSPSVLGDPLLKTQHFIGSSKWEKISDDEVVGWHQLRVPHQRYADEERKEIKVKGHAHGTNQHWYRKVEGVWKFAGLAPEIKWGEFDFDKVFESGRETFGEEQVEVAIVAGVVENPASDEAGNMATTASDAVEKSITNGEALHTASGGGSTMEKMPAEVTATMMQEVPDKYNTLFMEGTVGA